MFVFLPIVREIKHDVMTYAETYDFIFAKGWWSINELLLCSGVDNTLMVCDKSCTIHFSLFICLWLFSSNLSFIVIHSKYIYIFYRLIARSLIYYVFGKCEGVPMWMWELPTYSLI